jgi:hypothetical protein
MANDLIPELHDALKITTLQHNFDDFDERFSKHSPKTPSWKGIQQHHSKGGDEGFLLFPTDKDTFLLHLADGLAANFSRRHQNYRGEANFVLHKLWNPGWHGKDLRIAGETQIVALLNFLSKDPTYEDFKAEYGEILASRAEDAHPGMNITSLETHLTLTGKLYRLLRESKVCTVQDNEIVPSIEAISRLRESKKISWHTNLSCCKFRFNQKPMRARDLNIFSLLEDMTREVSASYYDHILYATTDEILLIHDEIEFLESVSSLAKGHGLWMAISTNKPRLIEVTQFLKALGEKRQDRSHIYPTLPDSITPPICEICQMASGSKAWPADYYSEFGQELEQAGGAVEPLCENCFAIRSKPSRLRKLMTWTEHEDTDVLWVRLRLHYAALTVTLQQLYFEYLRQSNPSAKIENAEIRFSLIAEFYKDYESFLDMLRELLLSEFGEERIEIVLGEMVCIKVDARKEVFSLLQRFSDAIDKCFPEFKKVDVSPIDMCVVLSRPKFPFFEVWRIMEAQTTPLQISLIGHGTIHSTLKYLDEILLAGIAPYRKSALHKLAEISKISERMAELKLHDRSERADFSTYEALKRNLLPLGMDFSSLLTFSKLLGN